MRSKALSAFKQKRKSILCMLGMHKPFSSNIHDAEALAQIHAVTMRIINANASSELLRRFKLMLDRHQASEKDMLMTFTCDEIGSINTTYVVDLAEVQVCLRCTQRTRHHRLNKTLKTVTRAAVVAEYIDGLRKATKKGE